MKNQFTILIGLTILLIACGQQPEGDKSSREESTSEVEEVAESVEAESPALEINKNMSPGEKLFILCSACHSLKKDDAHKTGPNLHGFFGSKAGVKEGFKFSEGLVSSGITWDDASLRKWIENPAEYVPGTSMAFIGIKDKKRQDILIEYLLEETK